MSLTVELVGGMHDGRLIEIPGNVNQITIHEFDGETPIPGEAISVLSTRELVYTRGGLVQNRSWGKINPKDLGLYFFTGSRQG